MIRELKYKDVLKCNWCNAEVKWTEGDYPIEDYAIVPRRIIVSDKYCEFILRCTNCGIFNKVIVPLEEVKNNK